METHVWIKGVADIQYAPIATLVLSIQAPLDRGRMDMTEKGEQIFLANGIVITEERWNCLKQDINAYSDCLNNISNGY